MGKIITLKYVLIPLLLFTMTACEQSPQRPRLRALSAREFYPLALERAQQWKSDAYLNRIRVDVLSEEDFTRQLEVSYGFKSPSEERHSLLVFFREDSDEPEVESIYHEVPIEMHNPIHLDEWSVDSVEALAISQNNGGNEFLVKHDHKMAVIILHLERVPDVPGARLLWRASFWDWNPRESVWIMLDPQTGKVIEVERQPPR